MKGRLRINFFKPRKFDKISRVVYTADNESNPSIRFQMPRYYVEEESKKSEATANRNLLSYLRLLGVYR